MPASYIPVDKLVAELGLTMALRLADAFGGTPVYVPTAERLRENHPLVMVLGMDAAKKLAREWPQHEVLVPMCADYLRRTRNRQVRADRETLTERAVALKHGLTDRHVRRICAAADDADEPTAEVDEAQQKLF